VKKEFEGEAPTFQMGKISMPMVFKFSFYEMNFILLVVVSYLLNSSDKT